MLREWVWREGWILRRINGARIKGDITLGVMGDLLVLRKAEPCRSWSWGYGIGLPRLWSRRIDAMILVLRSMAGWILRGKHGMVPTDAQGLRLVLCWWVLRRVGVLVIGVGIHGVEIVPVLRHGIGGHWNGQMILVQLVHPAHPVHGRPFASEEDICRYRNQTREGRRRR